VLRLLLLLIQQTPIQPASKDDLVSVITARFALIEGDSQMAEPRLQRIAGLTDQSTDNAYSHADTTPIRARVNGLVMVLIAEDVALREIPGIASRVHIVRTVGWQRIGTLFHILSSRLLEADAGARAAMALIARALQPKALVLAYCGALRPVGVMMLVSILAALCFRKTLALNAAPIPDRNRPSIAIRTPSTVDGARIRPIPAEILQGEKDGIAH
jgi:hypothetical protein